MVQGAPQTPGRFDEEIRMYKAPPPEVSTEAFYETDPTKPYKRGWSMQTVSPLPITWAEHVTAQGHWGNTLREYMRDYVHWATLGALCELLPQPDNRVTLADRDRPPRPARRALLLQPVRQRQTAHHRRHHVMEDMLRAAGAEEVMTIKRYAHLVGGARMATRPQDGVVDASTGCSASTDSTSSTAARCPPRASANPALTIMALAARAADLMADHAADRPDHRRRRRS